MKRVEPAFFCLMCALVISGCGIAPKFSRHDQAILDSDPLPYVKTSPYVESLKKLGDLLPLSPYYDPSRRIVIQIKPVTNKTACKQLPLDLTDMLKTAANRVGANVLITPYDPAYIVGEAQTGSRISKMNPTYVVDGSITECDEKIEEVSTGIDGNLRFGEGEGKTDVKAKEATQKTYSRIALDLYMMEHQTNVLMPNKQTSMAVDVWDIKKYRRIGFQVNGSGLGIDGRRQATQEKHNAVRTLADLSMLQLLGKTFEIPYWKTIDGAEADVEVLSLMGKGFQRQTPRVQLLLIQKMLILNGYSVSPTGTLDSATQNALQSFAAKHPGLTPESSAKVYQTLVTSAPATFDASTAPNAVGEAPVLPPSPAGDESGPVSSLPQTDPLSVDVAFVFNPSGGPAQYTLQNGSTMTSGDHYRLVMWPNKNCFIYVFQVDSAGKLFMLFPLNDLGLKATNPVESDAPYVLPGKGDAFILDNQTGAEKFFLLAATEKDAVVEELKNYMTQKTPVEQRKQAEMKLGMYLASKKRIRDAAPGKAIQLNPKTNVTASKIQDLDSSKIYEFSFQHR